MVNKTPELVKEILHDSRLKTVEELQAETHRAIYGNGNPEEGLVWIAKENRRGIADLKAFKDKIDKVFWKLMWFVSFGILSAFGSFMIALFKLWVNHGT